MTMSIAARCPLTGMVGVAVASSSIAVASRCAHVRAGIGAALSQNVTDPNLGRRALDLMQRGKSAAEVVDLFRREHPYIGWRQLVLLPSAGAPAVFSGDRTLGVFGESLSSDCAAAGNLLAQDCRPVAKRANCMPRASRLRTRFRGLWSTCAWTGRTIPSSGYAFYG